MVGMRIIKMHNIRKDHNFFGSDCYRIVSFYIIIVFQESNNNIVVQYQSIKFIFL